MMGRCLVGVVGGLRHISSQVLRPPLVWRHWVPFGAQGTRFTSDLPSGKGHILQAGEPELVVGTSLYIFLLLL